MKKIVGVALYHNMNDRINSKGKVILPPPNRHSNCFTEAKRLQWTGEDIAKSEQGFIFVLSEGDRDSYFATRQEAWVIAVENGQLINNLHSPPGILFSEHLW